MPFPFCANFACLLHLILCIPVHSLSAVFPLEIWPLRQGCKSYSQSPSTQICMLSIISSYLTRILIHKCTLSSVKVIDSSGGCGDFFQVLVVSPKFEGLTMIKQHRMVNQVRGFVGSSLVATSNRCHLCRY